MKGEKKMYRMFYLGRKPTAEEVLSFRRVLEEDSDYSIDTIDQYVRIFEKDGKMQDFLTRYFKHGFM